MKFLTALFGAGPQAQASRSQPTCRLSIDVLEQRSLPSTTPLPVIPPAVQATLQALEKTVDEYGHHVDQMVKNVKHDIATKGDVKSDLRKLDQLTDTQESRIDTTMKSILSNKNAPFRAKVGIWMVNQAIERLDGQIDHLTREILWDLQPAHHFTSAAMQDATAINKAVDRLEGQLDVVYAGVIHLPDKA